MSLLENDKPAQLEGVPTSAELDKDIKDYLDANKIFKQLKSAFQPSTTPNAVDTVVSPRAGKRLEPIQEEAVDLRVRSKKIEQLLTKVKKATS